MIRVLIADDVTPILKKISTALRQDDEIEIVAEVQSGYDAVMKTAMLHPDVVIMDVEMESRTAGLEATERILREFDDIKVIVFTVYEDDDIVFRAFQLGVCDYLLKNAKPASMISCVKDAYYGRSPIRPVIAKKIRREFQRVKNSEDSFLYCLHIVTMMTPSELDVLGLLIHGYTRTQICKIRSVELATVKTQISRILKKFDKDSIAEVITMIEELKIFDYLQNVSKTFEDSKQEPGQ